MNPQNDWDEGGEEELDPWASVVDLMSAFALVLFLAVTFFVINYNSASTKLKERQSQLVVKEKLLQSSILSLRQRTESLEKSRASEASLTKKNDEIQRQLILLAEQEKKLRTEREKLLGDRQALLADKEKLIADQEKLKKEKQELTMMLGRQEALVSEQKQLAERQKQATEEQKQETLRQQNLASQAQTSRQRCQERLESLLKQRREVLSAVYKSFVIAQQNNQTRSAVGFDPKTGRFRLGGEVLFAEGKDQLTPEGKRQLDVVMEALQKVVKQKDVVALLSGIMIEGHTSQTGSETTNWVLSSRRSLAALRYLLSRADASQRSTYAKLLFSAAYGPFRPVKSEKGTVDNRRSRRIEIKIVFKSQDQIQGILRQLN